MKEAASEEQKQDPETGRNANKFQPKEWLKAFPARPGQGEPKEPREPREPGEPKEIYVNLLTLK